MNDLWASRIAAFVLAALAAATATAFWLYRPTAAAPTLDEVQPFVAWDTPSLNPQALTWLLFASPTTTAPTLQPPIATSSDWTGVQLLGIVHAPRNGGHAVLAWPEQGAQTARTGQVLPNGWTLHSIEPHAITARRGRSEEGQQHRLELPQPVQP